MLRYEYFFQRLQHILLSLSVCFCEDIMYPSVQHLEVRLHISNHWHIIFVLEECTELIVNLTPDFFKAVLLKAETIGFLIQCL